MLHNEIIKVSTVFHYCVDAALPLLDIRLSVHLHRFTENLKAQTIMINYACSFPWEKVPVEARLTPTWISALVIRQEECVVLQSSFQVNVGAKMNNGRTTLGEEKTFQSESFEHK